MERELKSQLVQRISIGDEIICDITRHRNKGLRAHFYPISPETYWKTHRDINLTKRELREILEALEKSDQ